MLTPTEKLRIFLCHASQDKPLVRELFQRLKDEGWIDPWLDERKLLPGEDWRTSIEKAVESADLVVICLSKNSVNKEGFVQKELRFAREISLEKPDGTLFLVPIRLDMCEVPRGLRFIQWSDYFGDAKEQNYRSLIATFRKRFMQVLNDKEIQLPYLPSGNQQRDLQPIKSILSNYYERLDDKAKNPDLAPVVPTGFIDLDKMINGLQSSQLLVTGSRSAQNKTSFLLSIARNAALRFSKSVAIFTSLAMQNEEVLAHLIAQESGIDLHRVRMGRLDEKEWRVFAYASEVIAKSNIFIDDSPAISIKQLREKSKRTALENHLDLIIVDNLQFMINDENIANSPNYTILKVLARELEIPVLAGVQLSRNVEKRSDKRPQLSDLDYFTSLEDSANVVMFIHHLHSLEVDFEIGRSSEVAEIIVAKHDFGPIGKIELLFRTDLSMYMNVGTRIVTENQDPDIPF